MLTPDSKHPHFAADSEWKYRFGEGWSCVHVELEANTCRIQLLRQSFWESVANIFLKLIGHKTFKPKVEDTRIYSHISSSADKEQKIIAIKNSIFALQKKGMLPAGIKDKLIEEIKPLFPQPLETSDSESTESSDSALHEEPKQSADSEEAPPAHAPAEQEPPQDPHPDRPLKSSESESDHTASAGTDMVNGSSSASESEESTSDTSSTSTDVAPLPIPYAPPKDPASTPTQNFMKHLGYGFLSLAGSAAAGYLLSLWNSNSAHKPDYPSEPPGLSLAAYEKREGLRLDIEKLKTVDIDLLQKLSLDIHSYTPVLLEATTIEKALQQPSDLELLSKRIDAAKGSIQELMQSLPGIQQQPPSVDTPLTALSSTPPANEISPALFIAITGEATGGKVALPQKYSEIDTLLSTLTYLRDRLPLLGGNSEQRRSAVGLSSSLASISAIDEKLALAATRYANALESLAADYRNIHQQPLKEGQQSHEDRLRQAIKKLWHREVAEFKSVISEQLANAAQKGVFIPSTVDGEFYHLIPEKPGIWTLRNYTRQPQTATSQPFSEIRGLSERDFFAHEAFFQRLLASKISSSAHAEALPFALPNVPTDPLLEKKAHTPLFANVHDFPLYNGNAWNALIFVELGPEAYLDMQISTIRHYVDTHADALASDPLQYMIAKHAVSALAYASEKASAYKWIDSASLSEKSRILNDIGYSLRRIHFQSRKYRLLSAPYADESTGQRLTAGGKIPATAPLPLLPATRQSSESAASASIIQSPAARISIPLPSTIPDASLAQLQEVAIRWQHAGPEECSESIRAFRSWTASMLASPETVERLSIAEAREIFKNLAAISSALEMSRSVDPDTSLAFLESVCLADSLLHKINKGFQHHLPYPQIMRQLTALGITPDSFHPQLRAQAKALETDAGLSFLFLEGIQDRVRLDNEREFAKQLSRGSSRLPGWSDWRRYLKGEKLESIHAMSDEMRILHRPAQENKKPPSNIASFDQHLYDCRAIIDAHNRFAARQLVSHMQDFAANLKLHAHNPQSVIDAVHQWSKYAPPSAFTRMTLEALSPQQNFEIIQALGDISQGFMSANFQTATLLADPETMLVQLELLAFADQLMAYSKAEGIARFQLPLASFVDLIEGNSLFFRTFDPAIDSGRLQAVRDWLYERKSFFAQTQNSICDNPVFGDFPGFFAPEDSYTEWGYTDLEPSSFTRSHRPTPNPTADFTILSVIEDGAHIAYGGRLDDFRDHSLNDGHNQEGLQAFTDAHWKSPLSGISLPAWYDSLRKLCYFSFHTMRSGFINPLGGDATPTSFHPTYTAPKAGFFSSEKISEVHYGLEGVGAKDLLAYPGIPDGKKKGHLFSHLEAHFERPGILKNLRELHLNPTKHYKPGITPLPRDVYDLNVAMLRDADAERGSHASDDSRVKWSLRAERQLQPFLVISTYLEHPEWLTQTDEQIEFLNLLFEPGLLWHHFKEPSGIGPKAESDLAAFLQNQYTIHHDRPELRAYFAEVGLRVFQVSAAARQTAPGVYHNSPLPSALLQFASLPDAMLARKDLTDEERSTYSALKAVTFLTKDHLEPAETAAFFQAVLGYRSSNPLPMVNAMHTDRQIDRMLLYFREDLTKLLYPNGQYDQEFTDQFLNAAGKTNVSYRPSSANPLVFIDTEGNIEINLQDGSIIEKGKEGISLPSDARLSAIFTLVHGSANYRAKALDRFTFRFEDAQGYVNLIQKGPDRQWRLYRLFPDNPEPFQCMSAEWSQKGVPAPQKASPWLKSQSMLERHTHWLNSKTPSEVRLLDRHGQQAFRIDLSPQDGHTIRGIYKSAPSGEEWVLADIDQEAYAWTLQFEDAGYVHIWLSAKTGQGQQVDFLRSGKENLSFRWRNNQWQLESAPQYHLAKRQLHPIFPGQSNFLLLESDAGDQRLLMPRQSPNSKTLTPDVNFERQADTSAAQQILTFDKNPKTGKFNSPEVEPKLYLAMLHLSHRNYQEAQELLREAADLQEDAFTDAEMAIIDWIIEGTRLPSDDTPQATAVRTLAAHIKGSHTGNQRTDAVPAGLKSEYLKHASALAGLRLSPHEEAALFRDGIISGAIPLDQALGQLQLADPEKAREVLDAILPEFLFGKTAIQVHIPSPTTERILPSLIQPRPEPLSPQEISELVSVTALSANIESVPAELANVFDYHSDWFLNLPTPTQELFKSYEEGVKQFQASRDHNAYTLLDAEKFAALRLRQEGDLHKLTLEMEQARLHVLSLANPLPADARKAERLTLRMAAGTAKPVSFEQLVQAFGKNDLRYYRQLNPEISVIQAKQIDASLQAFIDCVPEWQYRKDLIAAMHAVQSSQEEGPEELQQALRKFAQAVKAGRKFPHTAKRLLKVMEYQTGSYYRRIQVENLAKLGLQGLDNAAPLATSAVLRMETGGGKTSRLLPTLLQSFAEEGKLALALMPEAQLASAGREFSRIMQAVYGTSTYELQFTRMDTGASLKEKLKRLEKASSKGKPVLTSGKSFRVLRNLLVESYTEFVKKRAVGNTDQALLAKIKTLQKIVRVTSATPIIDEVHKEFEPRIETNHPAGLERALPQEYGILSMELYDILAQDDIQRIMYFDFHPARREKLAKPFSQQRFQAEVAPLLADQFLQRLLEPATIDPELHELGSFLRELTPQQRQDVRAYALKMNTPEISSWVASQDESIRNQLALLRGELTTLLPATLQRKFGQGYGYVDREKDILPTPFSAADTPNIGSQFSSPFARYNYMIQALLHEGPRKDMLASIVADLQNRRLKELNDQVAEGYIPELGKRLQTQADDEFKKLFKTEQWNLDTPDLADKLIVKVRSDPALFKHVIKIYALNLIKVHPRNLKASSQHLGNMFANWQGLSATPNNQPAYPGNFTEAQDAAVKGRMLSLMAKHSFGKTHTLDIRDPKKILVSDIGLRVDAYMDAGGLLAGENMESIADSWSAQSGKATVRVDRELGLLIKPAPNAKAVPLHTSSLSPDQRKTLFAQSDIVGTDTKQAKNGVGLIGLDASTTIRAVEQAAGRMRQIDAGQTVEFLILEPSAIVMREMLGLPPTHQLTSEDVLRCLIMNESADQSVGAELSLRHKLHAVVDNFIFNWMVENAPEDAAGLQGIEGLLDATFFPEISSSPFELFGKDDIEMDKDKAFQLEIEKFFRMGDKDSPLAVHLKQVFGKESASLLASLKAAMEKTVASQLKYVSDKVTTRASCDMEEEQELLQEQNTEVLQNQQIEQQQQNIQQPPLPKTMATHKKWVGLSTESIATWSFWQPQDSLSASTAQLIDLPSLLSLKAATKELADLFSPDLAVSSNYQIDYVLDSPQKPAQLMLVIKNALSGAYRVAFLDPSETTHFKQAYFLRTGNTMPTNIDRMLKPQEVNDAKAMMKEALNLESVSIAHDWKPLGEPSSKGDTALWIGSVSGRQAFGDSDVFNLQDPTLKKLWAQAQIFAGRINFPEDQRTLIKEWLDTWAEKKAAASGLSRKQWLVQAEQFIKKLIASKEDVLATYHQSDLAKIFHELRI